MSAPLVSVIIVNWNACAHLRRCLASLRETLSYPHEIVVVDNASTDGSVEMVAKEFPAVRLVRNTSNRGFSAANNQGWQAAQSDYLVFLNADTEILADPFARAVEMMKHDDTIGCIGPKLLNPDHTFQSSVRRFPAFSDQLLILLKLRHFLAWTPWLRRYMVADQAAITSPQSVDQVMGAAIVIPRTVMTMIGGWDERYWIWFEDVDLCQRIIRTGKKVLYDPTAAIIHYGGQSFRQVVSLKKHRWLLQSLGRYVDQYWPRWSALAIRPFMGLSLVLTGLQMIVKPR